MMINGKEHLVLLGEAFNTGNYTKAYGISKREKPKARLEPFKSHSTNNGTVRLVKAFAKSTNV
jgi:hypothetical protein